MADIDESRADRVTISNLIIPTSIIVYRISKGMATENKITGIFFITISLKNSRTANSGICFLVSSKRNIKARIETDMLTKNVVYGSNPILKAIQDSGKINISKIPTTD